MVKTILTFPSLRPIDTNILSIPLGPRVLLTRSPIAIAPVNVVNRAISLFSSSASGFNIRTGLRETYN